MSELLTKLALCRSNIMTELGLAPDLPGPIDRLAREAVASIDAVLNVSQLYFQSSHAQQALSQVDRTTLQGGGVERLGLELNPLVQP